MKKLRKDGTGNDRIIRKLSSREVNDLLDEARNLVTTYTDVSIIFPDTIQGMKALRIFSNECLYNNLDFKSKE